MPPKSLWLNISRYIFFLFLAIAFCIAFHDEDHTNLTEKTDQYIIHPDELSEIASAHVHNSLTGDRILGSSNPESGSSPAHRLSYMFVFLTPPASFVYQQISLIVELSRRGHDILVASLEGFNDMLKREISVDDYNHTRLRVMEFARVFQSTSLVDLAEATQVPPEKRKKMEVKSAMRMYESLFEQVVGPLQLALQADSGSGALIRATFRRSIFVFPGPWATPIQFCQKNGFKYVNIFTTPGLAKLFSMPLYTDPHWRLGSTTTRLGDMSLRGRVTRLYRHLRAFFEPIIPIALDASHGNPTLRLVSSLPHLTEIAPHPPLTQFVGPLISRSRRSADHLPERVTDLLATGKPVIYLSFGTHAALSKVQVQTLANAFTPDTNPRWSFVWALPKQVHEHVPSDVFDNRNVAIVPWIESPAILSHPLTRLFVSHCGANGLGEAAVFGIPVLGLPLFGDQFDNCEAARKSLKFTVCHSIWTVSPTRLRQDVEKILFDASHDAVSAAKATKMLTQKIYTGTALAADWLETAAALRGDFGFALTEVDRSGVTIAYGLDIIAAALIILMIIVGTCGFKLGQHSHFMRKLSLKKVL